MRNLTSPTHYDHRKAGAAEIDMATLQIAQHDAPDGCDRSAFYARGDLERRHLYALRLVWRWSLGVAFVIGRSPGDADEFRDDRTTRRLRALVERSGCGALYVVNVYALRTNRLDELRRAHRADPSDVVGPLNSERLWREFAQDCSIVIGAWGSHLVRAKHGTAAAELGGTSLKCWGRDPTGNPNPVAGLSESEPLVFFHPQRKSAQPREAKRAAS